MSEGEPMKKLLPSAGGSLQHPCLAIYFQMTTGVISVSNTVNGKELPIYCVDTKEPKIAISFDAAWNMTILRGFWKFLQNIMFMRRFS